MITYVKNTQKYKFLKRHVIKSETQFDARWIGKHTNVVGMSHEIILYILINLISHYDSVRGVTLAMIYNALKWRWSSKPKIQVGEEDEERRAGENQGRNPKMGDSMLVEVGKN